MQKRKKVEYKGYEAKIIAFILEDDFSKINLSLSLDEDIFGEYKEDWHTNAYNVSLENLPTKEEELINSFKSIIDERIKFYSKVETLKKLGYE
jgi:hypothetical protein